MNALTAENVGAVFSRCLFTKDETDSEVKLVEAVVHTFGFHPARLAANRQEIAELLAQLPDEFQHGKGGGWSFLNACMTRDGVQWGEHSNIEQLLALGLATDQARIQLERAYWKTLPGGMPYFVVEPKLQNESTNH